MKRLLPRINREQAVGKNRILMYNSNKQPRSTGIANNYK